MRVWITEICLNGRVCRQGANEYDRLLCCSQCGLYVHKMCYGVKTEQTPWRCYPCEKSVSSPHCIVCGEVPFVVGPEK